MAKYQVKFNITVEVEEPFNVGKKGFGIYDEFNGNRHGLTDDQWNEIVSDAIDQMEDVGSCVSSIERV